MYETLPLATRVEAVAVGLTFLAEGYLRKTSPCAVYKTMKGAHDMHLFGVLPDTVCLNHNARLELGIVRS